MPADAALSISDPRQVLVRAVNWLGDAVMSIPAIQRVCQRFPRAKITLLTQEKLAELWQGFPGLDAIETFAEQDQLWSVARRLRGRRFDIALILPNSPRSALEAWLARVPCRVGFAAPSRRWLLTHAVPPPQIRPRKHSVRQVKRAIRAGQSTPAQDQSKALAHQVQHYLQLAAVLGCDPSPVPPRLRLSPDQIRADLACFDLQTSHATRANLPVTWLGLNLSAAYGPAKRWPLDRFEGVVCEISRRVPNCRWLNFGTAADWELGEHLARTTSAAVINLAGKTSLRQLMALLSNCRVLLSNDSGPMHLAAALGVAVVVPFGSTSPELTGPGLPGDPHHHVLRNPVACSPCFRRTCPIDFRCMTGITVESAVKAVLASLGQ